MDWPLLLVIPFAVFLVSMTGTRLLIRQLSDREILDQPNERSSHTNPIPRGAGIAVMAALLPAWALTGVLGDAADLLIVAGMGLLLAVVSWRDDLSPLNPLIRILVQTGAVITVIALAPFPGPVFGGWLPEAADKVLAGFLWIWFINLYNFMDGIDGLAGIETAAIGVGAFVIARKLGFGNEVMILALTLVAAAVGFLRWNWHPAKIFLGDVGSIPLGFLVGWLLLFVAAKGAWAPAVILPFYFLADATLTLLKRLVRGERIWRAHREHFYQVAVASGLRHDQVSGIVAVANMFLIMLAIVAARGQPVTAILGGCGAIALLLFLLVKGGPTD